MSVVVDLNSIKVIRSSSVKYVTLEFRGVQKHSSMFTSSRELIYVNERFKWEVGEPLRSGETLTVEINSKNLIGITKVIGTYTLGLQLLVSEGHVAITDNLIENKTNATAPAYLDMELFYTPPSQPSLIAKTRRIENASRQLYKTDHYEEVEVLFQPGTSQKLASQSEQSNLSLLSNQSVMGSDSSGDKSDYDDRKELINIQKNIASVEKTMQKKQSEDITIDIEPEIIEARSSRFKLGGRRFFRTFSDSSVGKVLHASDRKRGSTFRNVRSLIRFGRQRSRESSDDEEELLGIVVEPKLGGSASARPSSQTSISSNEVPISETRMELSPLRRTKHKIRKGPEMSNPVLKASDYQVCVTVVEARQLAGLNMDPVVCVQIGENKKYTSVKESTNCPYYNEYFVFDFHMPPIMLFDKIITLSVLQSRHILRANKLLGSFKLDVGTVWNQPDHQFYHKWAMLTDPDDMAAGPKGYLKCDISVIGKGDIVKTPPKHERDDDDIEANLLQPDGQTCERQRARFIVKIYQADGLPKMNYSILANVKRAFTGEVADLVNPFVTVCFAGMTGHTNVKKNCYSPVWNEQIIFTDMFPPLCQRIKIQLRDNDPLHPNIIGTHFIDLGAISNDGEKGFLPTFGPSYIHLYGSTRDYSLLDQHSNLNTGIGEGVSYRARILMSIRTELIDNIENLASKIEIEPTPPVNMEKLIKNEEFVLFCCVFDANMIDKKLVDKPLYFEISIGNAGNSLDGHNESVKRHQDLDPSGSSDLARVETGYWKSTTAPRRASSEDNTYFYLPYYDEKYCMHIRSIWPDYRRRLYNTNLILNIIDKFEEGLSDVQSLNDYDKDVTAVNRLKSVLELISKECAFYVQYASTMPPIGNTKLDKERQKECINEIDKLSTSTRNLRALVTKHSLKDRLRTAQKYLNKLKLICEDPQHALPDIFIWLIGDGKRLAYYRLPCRDIIYSNNIHESGKFCGKPQTLFFKWPGTKPLSLNKWSIPAKISAYFWLGLTCDKKHYIDGLPPGYEISPEINNADNPQANPPMSIVYKEKHTFQLRAYVYQARSLIGSDSSGLSDPYAKIIFGEQTSFTQVIDETLSPTWDECHVFDNVLCYGSIEYIKFDPPIVIIEIFDQDSVGKSEFIGRTSAKPHVKVYDEPYEGPNFPPSLEWYEIHRGDSRAGELLAAFELLELTDKEQPPNFPALPLPKPSPKKKSQGTLKGGPILPIPRGIRPTLSKYRIEVLFWGLRELKRVHFLRVEQPRVDIECAGHILYSTVITNASRNPNFSSPVKYIDVELPDQELYRPPLTIRAVDNRSFGRTTLVGTHTINSIQKHVYTPISKKEREAEERKRSFIPIEYIDLRTNRSIIETDTVTIENERENCPLLPRSSKMSTSYGSESTGAIPKKPINRQNSKKRKVSTDSVIDEKKGRIDWWSKFFASVDRMIREEMESKIERPGTALSPTNIEETRSHGTEINSPGPSSSKRKLTPTSPKYKTLPPVQKKDEIPDSCLAKIYPHELEAVPEFNEFKEWLQSFELYRGKNSEDDETSDSQNRVVGVFKGAIKVYKYPLPKEIDDYTVMGFDPNNGFFQGVPNNEPIHVLVRVYIVKATDLHPMDLNGKADPYIVLHLGSKKISDKDNYVSKQLNPEFGKCFEFEATFPQDSMLQIQVLDWDLVGSDDLIGETKIDLENRFYSRHRATCGLPKKYDEEGYNKWRNSTKPTQILAKLCKEGKLDPPVYECDKVKIGKSVFNMSTDDRELFSCPDTFEEQMALNVLNQWQNVPRVGTVLVPEHVETRPLYNPNKPGVEQGRLEMWVDMFPMDMPRPGPPMDISPRKPKSYEMRVIVWNTEDVVLEDDAFFTGEKMSDIYVKGWLKGPDDCQATDIHYRSLTGEGNFNWRFIYPFDYLEAEERIVISRKESVFSWDETECKIPARLELQVWDADHFTSDDFLGAITLDLNRFPRGAKSAQLCTLNMLNNDGSVPMVDIFQQKRVKGWWPFYIKNEEGLMELTGKVEAEMHLLTQDEAEKMPAGFGRNEPDPLEKPNRPDSSFMWFLNPLRTIRYILWHNYKWNILKAAGVLIVIVFVLLFLFNVPGYMVKKFLGA